jgi:hypothetical protein
MINNFTLLFNALTVYGRNVVNEVMELAECCDLIVAHDTYLKMGMNKHADCIDYLFFENE